MRACASDPSASHPIAFRTPFEIPFVCLRIAHAPGHSLSYRVFSRRAFLLQTHLDCVFVPPRQQELRISPELLPGVSWDLTTHLLPAKPRRSCRHSPPSPSPSARACRLVASLRLNSVVNFGCWAALPGCEPEGRSAGGGRSRSVHRDQAGEISVEGGRGIEISKGAVPRRSCAMDVTIDVSQTSRHAFWRRRFGGRCA